MKNLDSLNNSWDRSINKDSSLMTVPGANKKFKRKSREPKRLFSDPKPENLKNYSADMSDGDLVDDIQMEACNVSRLAPLQRKLMMSQGVMATSTGIYSTDGNTVPGQSSAIDMRIGINVPATASKPSPLPASPFANSEISHWPTAISQPLSNRLKLGLCSTFPLSASNSSSHSRSPKQEVFSLEASLSNQTEVMPVPRAFQTSQCHQHEEARIQSSKDSPTKRVSVNEDGPGRLPEVKAIQQTRRLLANARERTRVHTISAAFEALRKQVPCYSYGQKLSKLAILRIACNYILSLAQLVELDYSPDHSSLSFSQCVDQCTRTLQAEGRSKKRKD